MRIVATSDTHFPLSRAKVDIPAGDVFVLAGDFMYSGYLDEWHSRVEALSKLPHPLKILVPGNHDLHIQLFAGPALAELRAAGVTVVGPPSRKYHNKIVLPNGMTLGGCPYVSNLPGWAFNVDEDTVWGYLDTMGRVDILVAHSPPRAALDRAAGNGGHCGLQALRKYITRYQPDKLICGHVHEGYGRMMVDRTEVINVSMCNIQYEMVNAPVVLDFPDNTLKDDHLL